MEEIDIDQENTEGTNQGGKADLWMVRAREPNLELSDKTL